MNLERAQSFWVGHCHHGYRAYVITGTQNPTRRWHSGPAARKPPYDVARTAEGIELTPCEKGDPYAPRAT